jgi:serine phosphatase RsbU (regulator of sigma subunit)
MVVALGASALLPVLLLVCGAYLSCGGLFLAAFLGTGLPTAVGLLEVRQTRRHREEEMRRAEEIAQGLLPTSLPEGVRGMLQPALGAAGDYYDGVTTRHKNRVVVVADVSGKGLDAALLAGQLRAAFRAFAQEENDPGRLLERLNGFLYQDLERSGRLLTALVVTAHEDGTLRAASAAHPPVLVVSPDLPPRRIFPRGKPLGYASDTHYKVVEGKLRDGEWALLISDGILEEPLIPGGPPPGLAALEARLADLTRTSPPEPGRFARALLSQGTPSDDQTLVMLRKLKEPEH